MRRSAILKTVFTAAALASALAATAPAFAQQQRPGVSFPDFATMDVNKDGKVTREEFLAALPAESRSVGARVFDARDTNKDGVITRDEADANRR